MTEQELLNTIKEKYPEMVLVSAARASRMANVVRKAREMVYEDPSYWEHDYKEPEARALITALNALDESPAGHAKEKT